MEKENVWQTACQIVEHSSKRAPGRQVETVTGVLSRTNVSANNEEQLENIWLLGYHWCVSLELCGELRRGSCGDPKKYPLRVALQIVACTHFMFERTTSLIFPDPPVDKMKKKSTLGPHTWSLPHYGSRYETHLPQNQYSTWNCGCCHPQPEMWLLSHW